MRTKEGKQFRNEWKKAANQGVYLNRELMDNIHLQLNRALRRAMKAAEAQLPDRDALREQVWKQEQLDRATRRNDVQEILRLQQLN